jgi:GntR family transcriptional regulator
MPSVRALASQYLLNPLTVQRALQALGDAGLLDNRRGLGLFVRPGARQRLKASERQRFLQDEWPRLRERLRRLEISPEQLTWEEQR